jgi:predicted phosphodiesterase
MRPSLLPEMKTAPAVFAVGNSYQIITPVKSDLLFSVTVGNKEYFDHSNGIIRSSGKIRKVTVPMDELDKAREYTVSYRKIIDRKPYFPLTEEKVSVTYPFRPIGDGAINIYHISDTHGRLDAPASAGEYFGDELSLLVLNGDLPDHSGAVENFDLIYELCDRITGGEIPVIFSRGNHDMRGLYAESIENYTPTDMGRSYFTFRLGSLWGIVLDCGEDKPDSCEEYGYTICCHDFRLEESAFIENVIKNADKEYLAEGVEHRIAIAHNPFTHTSRHPFDIEQELYKKWTGYVKTMGAELVLSGHLHDTLVINPGDPIDSQGAHCPVIVGSKPLPDGFVGCALTLDRKNATVRFTNHEKEVLESKELKL